MKAALSVCLLAGLLLAGLSGCPTKSRSKSGKDIQAILDACPPIDIVYVMDTSASMDSIAADICTKIQGVTAELNALGVQDDLHTIFGITDTGAGGPGFVCIDLDLASIFGPSVPGTPNPGEEDLNNPSDWGPGGAVAAEKFPWRQGAIRIVVLISDGGAENGGTGADMIDADDMAAMQNLQDVALANGVIVCVMWGSNENPADTQDPVFISALTDIASATGGAVVHSPSALADLDDALFNVIVAACEAHIPPGGTGTGSGT